MSKKRLAMTLLVFSFATAAAFSTQPAAATPNSPGACNMLRVSPQGMEGMLKASPQGLGNMMQLVGQSEAAGCRL